MQDSELTQLDVLRRIVRAGIQAPSPDNSQPWCFRFDRNNIELSVDENRIGLFFDADMAATLMSCGAVVENMVLESLRNGLQPELTRQRQANPAEFVATLKLQPGQPQTEGLAEHISARATHRGLYSKRLAVTDAAKAQMEVASGAVPGTRILWCDSEKSRRFIMGAASGADLIRYTHQTIHRDFHAKLRFGTRADETSDGLADDTLGIERVLLPFLRLLSPWPLAKFLNYFGLHHFMAWRGCWLPMQTAPSLGVLTCDPDVDYFQMGRALQRVWLAATAAKLDFQCLGALPLLLIRLHQFNGAGLNDKHISNLRKLDQKWRSACGLIDSPEQLAMIFRIGHASKPPARARRRELASF